MVAKPVSKRIRFDRLLSENDLSESWVAWDAADDRRRFAKVSSIGKLDPAIVEDTMRVSFECQRKLTVRSINTALRLMTEQGRLIVLYRYFDPSEWKPVDASLFSRHPREILLRICQAVDLMHITGVVHRDLKLSNFLCSDAGGSIRVVLADLDFLAPAFTPMNASLIGTPGLIAPEIQRNEPYSPRSDNYSLGVSISRAISEARESDSTSSDDGFIASDGFRILLDSLTREEMFERPQILIDALGFCGLISEREFEAFNRSLVQNRILAALREAKSPRPSIKGPASAFFTDKIRLFGIHPELAEDIQAAVAADGNRAVWHVREFIRSSQLRRYSNSWSLTASDDGVCGLLGKIDRDFRDRLRSKPTPGADTDLLTEEYKKEHPLKAYILLKKRAEKLAGTPGVERNVRASIYRDLASLGATLVRHAENESYLVELLKCLDETDSEYLDALRLLLLSRIRQDKKEAARETISRGLELSARFGSPRQQLEFRRQHAWMLSADGLHDEALEELESVARTAEQNELHEVRARALYISGVACWRAGRFDAAEECLNESMRITKEHDCVYASVSSMEMMALLYFETADYERSERFHKLALKHAIDAVDRHIVPHACLGLMTTCIRLGRLDEARQWNQRYFAALPPNQNEAAFGRFYFNEGWTYLTQGELAMASEALHVAVDALGRLGASRNLGKVCLNLAILSLYQGDQDSTRRCIGRAIEIFEQTVDSVSLADSEAVDALDECHYGDNSIGRERLVSAVVKQIDHKSWYLACFGTMNLILMGVPLPSSIVERIGPFLSKQADSRVSLFAALNDVWPTVAGGASTAVDISALKAAYRSLNQAGHYFLAMLVCIRIADACLDQSNTKLAQRFLMQALTLAQRIHNGRFKAEIEARLGGIRDTDSTWQKTNAFAKDLSSILQDIGDYQGTLDRILRFAVDRTGAERGVLLLRSDRASDLRIRSSLNCDDQSLTDVSDFSRTVVRNTSEGFEPLVIANAIEDARTSGYKSIMLHNILSVICMPIRRGGESTGVLYLDHHTIPALFDHGDLELISGIANLISLVLAASRELSQVKRSHAQLLEDLANKGMSGTFVTQDTVTLSLLEKLPDIAKSDSSVLIFGESGTGKEILAEMLHHLSPRSKGPLIKLNCAAIPESLIESELFGMAKNTASGVSEKEGKFEAADGGTLFLDEIGDMPLSAQAKILRVTEYQSFSRVGSNQTITTDVRLVYATNKDLAQLVREGAFRHDLFHRINKIYLEIPPLRDRQGDIPFLIDYFTQMSKGDNPAPRFSSRAMERILNHEWPGNVRVLRSLVEFHCTMNPGQIVDVGDLPKYMQTPSKRKPSVGKKGQPEEAARILKSLNENDWNQSAVSRNLKMPMTTLRRKIKKYGLRRKR